MWSGSGAGGGGELPRWWRLRRGWCWSRCLRRGWSGARCRPIPRRAGRCDRTTYVPGPRNVDGLAGEITSDGGTSGKGVLVGFDRTSRAESEGPPAAAAASCSSSTTRSASARTPSDLRPYDGRVGRRRRVPRGRAGRTRDRHLYPDGTAEVYAVNTRHPNGMRGALVVIPATTRSSN